MSMGCCNCNGYHEFNLDWIIKTVEELSKQYNNLENDFANLKDYVDNYFESLDVSQEVKAAVDALFESGSAQGFLDPWNLKDKKIVWLGDSLVYGDTGLVYPTRVTTPIPARFAKITGANCVNAAANGAHATTYLSNGNDLKNQLETTDLTDADYVILEFGTNDFNEGTAIGDVDSTDWNCLCGAYNNAINHIYSINQNAIVIVLGLFPSHKYFSGSYNTRKANIYDIDEGLRAICRHRHVRYIDMLHNSGFTDDSIKTFTSTGGTHFTQLGYDILTDTIIRNFGGNYPYATAINNFFNKNSYPQYNAPFTYACKYNGNNSTWKSYTQYSFGAGRYMLDFDYDCDITGLDTSQYYAGVHLLYVATDGSSYFITSPTGLRNGNGHIRCMFTVDTPFTGELAFRLAGNSPTAVCNNLSLKNLTISPCMDSEGGLNGVITTSSAATTNSEKLEGDIVIARMGDGMVQCNYSGNLTAATNAYQALATGSYFRRITNVDRTIYFPLFYSRGGVLNIARGQLVGSNIACNVNLEEGDSLSWSFNN